MGKLLPLTGDDGKLESLAIMRAFYTYLAPKPYCTDMLGHLLIRPKAIAIRSAYIQPNPITRAYWIVFDIDSEQSRYWGEEWDIPTPNIEIRNPENNHQHLFYQIDPAVYTLRQARRKPLELAADVDKGLTALLGADPGYGKLIAKNPFHSRWTVYVWHEEAWGLTELIEWIPDRFLRPKQPRRETIGLGRNCTVFDTARDFAYSEWRRLKFQDDARLFEHVYDFSMNVNADFNIPLLPQEVKGITRSITKWTVKHLTKEGFEGWGDKRRERSIIVRHTKSEERAMEAKALYAGGKTQKQIAAIMDISERQIKRLLKSS